MARTTSRLSHTAIPKAIAATISERMSTSEALNTDIREITEMMGRVDVNGTHDVQFLCTCSLNEGDCEEARERVRATFLRFADVASIYLVHMNGDTGELNPGRPRVKAVRYQTEAGDNRRRAHVHAVIQATGKGKVMFDLPAIRRDFPRVYWHFDYSRQPRSPEQALQSMVAYAGKSIGRGPPKAVTVRQVEPDTLTSTRGVTHVGTTSNIARTRRTVERAGGSGVVRFAPLTSQELLQEVLDAHPVWKRRPKKTASFIYVITPE